MKILVINGSPNKKGKVSTIVSTLLASVKVPFTEETIYTTDLPIKHCRGCRKCRITGKCILNDGIQEYYQKIRQADILILETWLGQ